MPFSLDRRTFLRGLGVSMALPMMEAMVPRGLWAASGSLEPTRLLVFYVPNGMHMPAWSPTQTGENYELTPILAPLAAHKSDILVLSGLDNLSGVADVPGDHARGTGSFLTCMPVFKTQGDNIKNGISLDQHIAKQIGGQTRFSSLEFGAEGDTSASVCDHGYSCSYIRNIAWSGPSTPVAKEVHPREAFNRLFGDRDSNLSAKEAARRKISRLSILDYVREDTQRLQSKLGTRDQQKLDQYLTGVFELEKQLLTLENEAQCSAGPGPALVLDTAGHVRAMCDIMVLAMKCDQTRVMSFMLGNGLSNRVFGNLGHTDGHHRLSHHSMEPAKLQAIEEINIWELQQFAYLLDQMKTVEETNGTLLDNSIVYFSSEVEDGDAHRHTNLPVLIAGRAGGQIKSGRHIQYDHDPIADLYVSFMNMMGVEGDTFGADGTGPLGQLS